MMDSKNHITSFKANNKIKHCISNDGFLNLGATKFLEMS